MNGMVAALRFFFSVTCGRPEMARHLTLVRQPRKQPVVLSQEEVGRLLEAAPGPKWKAALSVAYGAGLRVSEVGCPNLRSKAWTAATLAADLDRAARDYINHPRGATILTGNRLRVSSIYKWFAEDFGGTDAGKIAHLRKYAGPRLAAALSANPVIAEAAYDWSLNDVKDSAKSQ